MAVDDECWIFDDFIPTVAKRGAAIIDARGASSAASAANAAIDHVHDWVLGTPDGDWVSMGIPADGSYDIPEGIISGHPVHVHGRRVRDRPGPSDRRRDPRANRRDGRRAPGGAKRGRRPSLAGALRPGGRPGLPFGPCRRPEARAAPGTCSSASSSSFSAISVALTPGFSEITLSACSARVPPLRLRRRLAAVDDLDEEEEPRGRPGPRLPSRPSVRLARARSSLARSESSSEMRSRRRLGRLVDGDS